MKSNWYLIARLAMLASCGVIAFAPATSTAQDKKQDAAEKTAKGPSTHKVKPGKFRIQVKLQGYLAPVKAHRVILRPQAWSSWKLHEAVAHGQRVQRGEVILRVRSDKLERELDDLRRQVRLSEIKAAIAQVEFELGRRRTEISRHQTHREAERAVDELEDFQRIGRSLAERSAEMSLRNAQYRLEYAEEELHQLRKMYEADELTEETEEIVLKRAERDVESAAFYLEVAKHSTERRLSREIPQQLESLEQSAELARLSVEELERTAALQDERSRLSMESARREHEQLVERLHQLEADLEAMTVRAPFDGVVYYGDMTRGRSSDAVSAGARLRPGNTLSPGSVILTVVAPRPLVLIADAAEDDLFRLQEGQTCRITPKAFPYEPLGGHVESVGRVPISPGKFEVRVAIPTIPDAVPVMPGMAASAQVTAYEREQALTIPTSCIVEEDGAFYVFVKHGDQSFVKQSVKLGQRTKEHTEVLDGLKAGDMVQVDPPK